MPVDIDTDKPETATPTDRGGRAHDPEVIADVREQLEAGSFRFTGENPANSENEPSALAQPMDPERLADVRNWVETSTTPAGSWLNHTDDLDTIAELLADRDRLAAQAKTLARAVFAWQRLGDRGFGDPSKWDCYEHRGWKLDMSGNEAFFDTEFEAQAIKTACVNAHGLAETVLGAGS